MAPRTRSTTSSPTKKAVAPPVTRDNTNQNPVKIFIAPQQISADARILSLPCPTNGLPKRFIFDSGNGIFEIKRVTAPKNDLRSVIFSPSEPEIREPPGPSRPVETTFSNGFVNQDAEALTATPFDLAFVLLRAIVPQDVTSKKSLFQPLDDLFEIPEFENDSVRFVLTKGRNLVEAAMATICDMVDAGGEKMFRYSEEKLFTLVLEKAQRVAESGLPASLEEHYVIRVLEAPISSISREDTTIVAVPAQPTIQDDAASANESPSSQSNTNSTAVSAVFSEVSACTTISVIEEDRIPLEVKRLQRIRVAYNFIVASYLPSTLSLRLSSLLSEKCSPINFATLDNYLQRLAQLQAEAASLRSLTDFNRKRNLEADEIAEERLEKKRKLEEEEKRKKANESRGVRDLKKVNVSGMKKMSDFFSKKPAVATAKT